MTVNPIPSSASSASAGEGTAVSPVFQLLPENRGMSFPSASSSVSLSGNLIRICIGSHSRSANAKLKGETPPRLDAVNE